MAITWKQIAYQSDVSTADSKAVSAGVVGAAGVTAASTADSKAVSNVTAISTADSKAVSAGVVAGTAATSASVSTADSKAVSAGVVGAAGVTAASTADSKAVSNVTTISTADSKAVSAGTLAGTHATRHKNGGADEILLNELGEATSAVPFNGQQGTDFVVHTVATSAAITGLTPVPGKLAWNTADLDMWVCSVAA